MRKLLVLLAALVMGGQITSAQSNTTVYQAFITNDALDRLTFIDVLTGAQTTFDFNGDRYALLEDGVMFFDYAANRVRMAAPNGALRDHPFVQLEGDARRIDWIMGGDRIAWTLTSGTFPDLVTATWIANRDGSNRHEVLADSTGEGVRAFPVALDETHLYLDYQPDSIGDITPFRQYAALFSVDLTTGATQPLPGEPGCFCGAAIRAGRLIRLTLAANLGGFDVRVVDLASGTQTLLPSLGVYTQGGDVLIAPDGLSAVYALGEITNFGTTNQRLRTVIARIDLTTMTQSVLVPAVDRQLRPLGFTDGALLLYDPQANRTFKADLATGVLAAVAQAQYLGTVQNS